jgi:hypothetical protein
MQLLPRDDRRVDVCASRQERDVHLVPRDTCGTPQRDLHHVSRGRNDLGVCTSVIGVHVHDMPHPTCGAPQRDVHVMPPNRHDLEVQASVGEVDLHVVSRTALGPQERYLHVMPFDWQHVAVQASRQELDLHVVSRTALGPQERYLHFVSLGRHDLEVQPSDIQQVRVVSLGTEEPLRNRVCVLSLAHPVVEKRDVQPPDRTWQEAHLQKLRLLEVPPQRLLQPRLHELPRG